MALYNLTFDVTAIFLVENPVLAVWYGGVKIKAVVVTAQTGQVSVQIDTDLAFNHTSLRFNFQKAGTEADRTLTVSNIKIDNTPLIIPAFTGTGFTQNGSSLTLTRAGYADYETDNIINEVVDNMPAVIGTAGNDTLYGTEHDDSIEGREGNDKLHGQAGRDTIFGGLGDDVVSGGAGDDLIYGDDGNDKLYGDDGNDTLEGGAGNDRLEGGNGNDTLSGGAGNDTMLGGAGSDVLYGGDGDDLIYGNGGGNDTIYGGNGLDKLYGAEGDDIIYGDADRDIIGGYGGNDTLYGGDGDDHVDGQDGNDIVRGDAGNDKVYGGAGDDDVRGGSGNDEVHGQAGTDLLYGDDGDDRISGGDGNDTAYGGTGNDFITGDDGDDVRLDGQDGDDIVAGGFGSDLVIGGAGNDILYSGGMDSYDVYLMGQAHTGLIFSHESQSMYRIVLAPANWADAAAAAAADIVGGVAGRLASVETAFENSFLTAQMALAGASSFWLGASDAGSEGTWRWTSGYGAGTIFWSGDTARNNAYNNFGAGEDDVSSTQNHLLLNAAGGWEDTHGTSLSAYIIEWNYEALMSETSANALWGNDGTDTLFGAAGADTMRGGNDADLLYGYGGDDFLYGEAGADVIYGGDGADTIHGGSESDILYGGAGADHIDGGSEDDTIYLANGDFASGEVIIGGAGTDSLILIDTTVIDFVTGTLASLEILTGNDNNETITLLASHIGGMFTSVNLGGGTDTLNVVVNGDLSAQTLAALSGIETGNLIGTATGNVTTMTGAQLDAILIGTGTINLGGGTDTINLTSTSADLNTLGATDGSIVSVEHISFSTAATGITLDLSGQSEGFILTGSAQADIIRAGTGADTINAGDGDDIIRLFNGSFAAGESINGGNGTDSIVFMNATTVNFGTGTLSGIEILTGFAGNDTITLLATQWAALSAINMVSGTDVLNVQASGNISALGTPVLSNIDTGRLIGTGGNDSVTLTGAQLDAILIGAGTINLGGGTDTIHLTSTSSDLNALSNAALSGVEIISAATAGAGVTITLSNQSEALTIIGSSHDDIITGGTIADTIDAGDGDDTIRLANGHFDAGESINGGDGHDTVILTNATTVNFNAGTFLNVETLTGSSGNDDVTLSALQWASLSALDLGGGTDVLKIIADGDISGYAIAALSGIETGSLLGTSADNSITLTGEQLDAILIGAGTLNLSGGTDTLNLTSTSSDLNLLANAAFAGVEIISAALASSGVVLDMSRQSERLTIIGSAYNDDIHGATGVDIIQAGDGDDIIRISSGDFDAGESIDGGDGNDTILLTEALVVTFTNGTLTGIENIIGSSGVDDVTISAAVWAGLTLIDLGGGNDILDIIAAGDISSLGAPSGILNVESSNLLGTSAADIFTVTGSQLDALLAGNGIISFGGGVDRLNLTSTSADLNALNNASLAGLEQISGELASAGIVISLASQSEAMTVTGSAYDDILTGGSGADTLIGGDGDDVLTGGNGNDILRGGAGNDILIGEGGNDDIVDYTGASSGVTVDLATGIADDGDGGTDTLATIENVRGSSHGDTIRGSASVNDLYGEDGDDLLYGGGGNDVLYGGNGDDILNGEAGTDTLWGGGGADTFQFNATSGADTVRDFNAAEGDKLDISNILSGFVEGVSDIDNYLLFVENGSNTTVRVDANGLTGGTSWTTIATLSGVTGLSVQDLYDNGQIIAV